MDNKFRKVGMKVISVFLILSVLLVAVGYAGNSGSASSKIQSTNNKSEKKEKIVNSKAIEPADVDIESGTIKGYKWDDTYRFLGIPYGTAGRFEDAKTVEPWEGTKTAFVPGKACAQNKTEINKYEFTTVAETDLIESEDCLNLNVWTQDIDGNEKKPVMVFLHGGGLTNGSSMELTTYDGANLSSKGDIVFVSVNHRLNALGYLDLSAYGEEYKNTGNLGMVDIVLALQWVQDNIEQFGGDPENVTIYGQSGGGSKVASIMSMPSAKGLFDKAVIASSLMNGRDTYRTVKDAQAQTEALLKYLGLSADEVNKLKTIPYEQLRKASDAVGVRYQPVVGGASIPEPLVNVDGKMLEMAKGIPLIHSTTFSEFIGNGVLALSEKDMKDGYFETHYRDSYTDEMIDARLEESFGQLKDEIVEAFKKAYPGHDLFDLLYIWERNNSLSTAKANLGGAPVYQAVYAWTFPMFGGVTNAHTTGDFPFVFNNPETVANQIAGNEVEAYELADDASSTLINFLYTGNPSTDELNWKAFTVEKGATMVFDSKSKLKYYHDLELMKLIAQSKQK